MVDQLCVCKKPLQHTKVVKVFSTLEVTQNYCQRCNKPTTDETEIN